MTRYLSFEGSQSVKVSKSFQKYVEDLQKQGCMINVNVPFLEKFLESKRRFSFFLDKEVPKIIWPSATMIPVAAVVVEEGAYSLSEDYSKRR